MPHTPSMKCIRFDVCKVSICHDELAPTNPQWSAYVLTYASTQRAVYLSPDIESSMKCIRFDVCKWWTQNQVWPMLRPQWSAYVLTYARPGGTTIMCRRAPPQWSAYVLTYASSTTTGTCTSHSLLNEVHTFWRMQGRFVGISGCWITDPQWSAYVLTYASSSLDIVAWCNCFLNEVHTFWRMQDRSLAVLASWSLILNEVHTFWRMQAGCPLTWLRGRWSSMKCIRFDVCKDTRQHTYR